MFEDKHWQLTDEVLKEMSAPRARIRVNGKSYIIDPNQEDLVVGDVVLDRKDGLHGVIDMIMPSALNSGNIVLQAAVRDGCCSELGVPLSRLVRLKPYPENAN